jgi:RNA polymerase sigma factor (sigma-70 family)
MGRLIAYQAKQTPLTAHDIEDAQQNAVFALVEAIAGYNTLEMLKPGGCRFRTYGRLVTMRRFWDFVKHLRQRQKRCHCLARMDGPVAGVESEMGADCWAPATPSDFYLRQVRFSDPAEAAARQEMLERLSQVLGRLEEKKRTLWRELAGGKKLRQIACEQGLSYDAVKRQRRKLLVHLSAAVGQWAEPTKMPAPFSTQR